MGQVTPIMLQSITYGTYLIFGILTFLGAGFIWFFVPETKRLTLEEMVSTPNTWLALGFGSLTGPSPLGHHFRLPRNGPGRH